MCVSELTGANDGTMTLHEAAWLGCTETCKTLIEQGADINAEDK